MRLQQTIRRILREEIEFHDLPIQIRRRFDEYDLQDIIDDCEDLIDSGKDKTIIYDVVRRKLISKKIKSDDIFSEFEKPLIHYIKLKLKEKGVI